MMKNISLVIVILILLIPFTGCENNVGPTTSDVGEISDQPKLIEFSIDPASIQTEHFPIFSVDYSALKLDGINLTTVKYYYPAPNLNITVDREFVVAANDSFEVEIRNCRTGYEWYIDFGSVGLGGQNNWTNSEVTLSRTEEVTNSDSTITYQFVFRTLREGKGYICFIEEDQLGRVSSNESHGLLVGYTADALSKIWLNVDEIKWIYNTEQGTFSTVSVKIRGNTNVYRLRGMTYGDGVSMAMEIPLQNNTDFEIEIPIAFSHMEGVTLKTNSELLLYGTVGLPKVISLRNPENGGQ
jgi:hypothetical protein